MTELPRLELSEDPNKNNDFIIFRNQNNSNKVSNKSEKMNKKQKINKHKNLNRSKKKHKTKKINKKSKKSRSIFNIF
jgi:hypothetical protein